MSLRLNANQLTTLPDSIGEFSNLTSLTLNANQLTTLPDSIGQLSNLTLLNLKDNQLTTVPDSIRQLTNLAILHLELNNRRMTSVEAAFEYLALRRKIKQNQAGKAKQLQILEEARQLQIREEARQLQIQEEARQLQIREEAKQLQIREEAKQLQILEEAKTKRLPTLDLSGMDLTILSPNVLEMPWLTELNLANNQLTYLPNNFYRLTNLTKLNLANNPLETPPLNIIEMGIQAIFQYLKIEEVKAQHLQTLDLSGMNLTVVPSDVLQMTWLKELNLANNQLDILPEGLSKLSNLTTLILYRNRLTELPDDFCEITNLTHLQLSGNQLITLPDDFGRLKNLTSLQLSGNPLVSPPVEIARKGVDAIAQYFTQLDEVGKSNLYEAKLLLVGEPGAGKTTLARKLKDPSAPLPTEGESTEGIDIIHWSFTQLDKPDFRVNVWDFAGQEIYYSTHRFFLTHSALYLLVADARKDDTYFDYWLNIISLLSKNSPVIIITNEKDDRTRHININALRGHFSNLEEILSTNLATRRGLEEIYKKVQHYISILPHVGKVLPNTWVEVREALENNEENYISRDKFFSICKKAGFIRDADKLQLSDYLHTIGVILHYQDDPILKNIIFLNPEWCTAAVYKVLDTEKVIKNHGLFTKDDLTEMWKKDAYLAVRDELLQLMIKFELCYPVPTLDNAYIVPQLLTEEIPLPYEWDESKNLFLQYEFEFMPKGMLWQLIIALYTYIWEQLYVWRSGVILDRDGAKAEVVEFPLSRRITVRISGHNKRDLMTVIRHEFSKIFQDYNKLAHSELIPCNCKACQNRDAPHSYDLQELIERLKNEKDIIECRLEPYNMVNVRGLIDDVINIQMEAIHNTKSTNYTTHIENATILQGNEPNYTKKESDMSKTITISNVTGSNLNIKSELENVNQTINSLPQVSQQEKKDFEALIAKFRDALTQLPEEKEKEAKKIIKRLDSLLDEVADEEPDKEVVDANSESLLKAAKNIEDIVPAVLNIAGKIVAFIGKVVLIA